MKQLGEATKTASHAKHQTPRKQRNRKAPETTKPCETKEISAAGNWTRVFRMTSGNTNHYTTADSNQEIDKCRGSLETRKTLNNLEPREPRKINNVKRVGNHSNKNRVGNHENWEIKNIEKAIGMEENHAGLDKANSKSSRTAWSSKNTETCEKRVWSENNEMEISRNFKVRYRFSRRYFVGRQRTHEHRKTRVK